jgi:hypothetical protein
MTASYDNPLTITYAFGLFDFGGAGDITAIPVPNGKTRGRVEEIYCMAAEIFTTGGKIEVGTAADPNHYAQLLLLTTADTDGLGFTAPASEQFDIGHGGLGVFDIATEGITQLEVVLTITGGTPTGQGFSGIVVSWW